MARLRVSRLKTVIGRMKQVKSKKAQVKKASGFLTKRNLSKTTSGSGKKVF
jgi:hypothetical protein